jgi:hypothetical protein
MIDLDEVITKLCNEDEATLRQSMNPVADFYRNGADLQTLIPILTHSNPRVVECGVWIASEVVDWNYGREIFNALVPLLDHPTSAVRFWAIASITCLLTPEDHAAIQSLFLKIVDPSLRVRLQALHYVCLIPNAVIQSLQNTNLWASAHLLLTDSTKDEVRLAIKSDSLFNQRMAFLATMRNFGEDDQFVQEILKCCGDEVSQCGSSIKCFSKRRRG